MFELILPTLSTLLGVLGTLAALQAHIRGLKKEYRAQLQAEIDRNSEAKIKAYAAERDFNHLRNNQEQFKQAMIEIQDDLDKLQSEMIEQRTIAKALYGQLQQVTAILTGESSIGWRNRNNQQ